MHRGPGGFPPDARVLWDHGAFALVEADGAAASEWRRAGYEVEEVDPRLHFAFSTFDPLRAVLPLPATLLTPSTPLTLVQFRGPPAAAWVEALSARTEIVAFLPSNAFLVRPPEGAAVSLDGVPAVRWTGPFHAGYRIDPAIDLASSQRVPLLFLLLPGAPGLADASLLSPGSSMLVPECSALVSGARVVLATAPAASVPALAARDDVLWIEPVRGGGLAMDLAAGLLQSGDAGERPLFARGLSGRGEVVGIVDTGLETDGAGDLVHELFRDPKAPFVPAQNPGHRKVAAYLDTDALGCAVGVPQGNLGNPYGHGTRVTGIAVGDAPDALGAFGTWNGNDGHAPGAKVVLHRIHKNGAPTPYLLFPLDLPSVFREARDLGARIHSNSWGVQAGKAYGVNAWMLDRFGKDHPDSLLVFAAGNEGDLGLRMEAQAKNVLAVGGVHNAGSAKGPDRMYDNGPGSSSSRGPAFDGRIKPSVLAPATKVGTADVGRGPVAYADRDNGTSYATPAVAGLAALLREHFRAGRDASGNPAAALAFDPSAALLRALVIHAGRQIGSDDPAYPGTRQGWGRVVLADALPDPDGPRRLHVVDGAVRHGPVPRPLSVGDEQRFTYRIGAGAALRVTLAWTDPPALPGAGKALVSDLNLEVTAPDGTVYEGNAYDPGDRAQSRPDPAAPADAVNVEEDFLLHDPQPGLWSVRVWARSAPLGPQSFALVVSGPVEPFA